MPTRLDSVARHPATLAVLWAAAVAVVGLHVDHFWIPLDDGTLAQSAERVLEGELPHRDFGDPYSGLNAVLGALAFRLFGVSLDSLRISLVVGFAAWLPAVWLVARRFAGPAAAAWVTGLVALTSVLAYPAAMPTWFGLFAATWGLAFLLRWTDSERRGWLVAVGAAAGVSLLFKVTGLYFLAAALLTVAWHRRGGGGYAALCAVGGVVFLGLLGRLVLPGAAPSAVVHFFLPGLAVTAALVIRARPRPGPSRDATRSLFRDGLALKTGAAAPILLFLVPYLVSGSAMTWIEGVFLVPTNRFEGASSGPGPFWTVLPGVGAVGLAWGASRLDATGRRWLAWSAAALLTVALAADDALDGAIFSALWYAVRAWIPALAVWGAWLAYRTGDTAVYAVVATAALWALVQFPYAAPAYLFYVAPLGVLATLAVIHADGGGGRPVLSMMAVLWLFLGGGYVAGVVRAADATLPGERAGIRVSAADSALYGGLVDAVHTHAVEADGGSLRLWVTPDAPEVYFLTGAANPTPMLYEFLDPRADRVPDLDVVDLVVINTRPLFSATVSDERRSRLAAAGFVRAAVVGPFEIHVREPRGQSAGSPAAGSLDAAPTATGSGRP